MRNTTLWNPDGVCPYGKVCELPRDCPGIEINVAANLEEQLGDEGLSVSAGFRPAHAHLGLRALSYTHVEICDKALGDPAMFERATQLEAIEIKDL